MSNAVEDCAKSLAEELCPFWNKELATAMESKPWHPADCPWVGHQRIRDELLAAAKLDVFGTPCELHSKVEAWVTYITSHDFSRDCFGCLITERERQAASQASLAAMAELVACTNKVLSRGPIQFSDSLKQWFIDTMEKETLGIALSFRPPKRSPRLGPTLENVVPIRKPQAPREA